MKAKEFKKKINKLWHFHKKDWDKVLKNTERLARQGERYIKDQSEKGKARLEIMALNLQKEKLYYELGKALAKVPLNKWKTAKKALAIASNIKSINRKIGRKKEEINI